MATGLTKLALSTMSGYGVLFRTKDLPWGWSGATEVGQAWLDLRGPYGSQLFVSSETEEVMEESKRCQELLLGVHFPSITLSGRNGFGGGDRQGGMYVKWTAVKADRPGTYIVFLYQSQLDRDSAELEFEALQRCVEIVELLDSGPVM